LYVHIGIQPIAFVHLAPDQTAEIYYIMTDYSHRPFIVANAAGAAIWASQADPFGVGAPNEDYDQDGINLTLNLRFPGQYFDAESGLHYNLNRYYDPTTGRYLESDPIGLKGGLNTYAYVGGNPVNFVDPLGLDDYFIGAEIDLVGIFGVEISFGFVYDSDRELDSGLFFSMGHGVGANVGAGITAGYADCDIEGVSISGDVNVGPFSFQKGQGTDTGFFSSASLGIGIGASSTVNKTYSYTIQDYIDWVLN
jgi:RHS repeat-associated protein